MHSAYLAGHSISKLKHDGSSHNPNGDLAMFLVIKFFIYIQHSRNSSTMEGHSAKQVPSESDHSKTLSYEINTVLSSAETISVPALRSQTERMPVLSSQPRSGSDGQNRSCQKYLQACGGS
jgi:hypothetical protein